MNSKDAILSALRSQQLEQPALPDLKQAWIEYENPLEQFLTVLRSVGARCHQVSDVGAVNSVLAGIPEIASARQIVSLVPGVGLPNVDLAQVADPHQLETLDLAILPGEFGVAENGAIWVTSAGIKHRAIYVITQRLVLVVPARQIVHNMHQAYERVAPERTDWGAFISGPSKTADIEQSLVVGAHGPRSLDVFCLDTPIPTR